MNKRGRMMNEEGFMRRDDTMKKHELNLEEKIVFGKFSLCITQPPKKITRVAIYTSNTMVRKITN